MCFFVLKKKIVWCIEYGILWCDFEHPWTKTIAINFMSFVKEPSHVALRKARMYTMCVVGKALGREHYENKGRALILVVPSPWGITMHKNILKYL